MGYYTRYELQVKEGDMSIQEILEQVEYGFKGIDYAIDMDGESLQEVKWYDHEDAMRSLSETFPNILFQLDGEGEESGDVWKKYFKNGKMQYCPAEITFDEYDENKLT